MVSTVTKRSGAVAEFDISRIRKVIEWACEGTDVKSHVLESAFTLQFNDCMQTSKIQKSLINVAIKLTSAEAPDWRIVAARLELMDLKKSLIVERGYKSLDNYSGHVKTLIANNLLDKSILDMYPLTWFDGIFSDELERGFDFAGVNSLIRRYLVRDSEGKVVESLGEMFLTISIMLASKIVDESAGAAEVVKRVREIYDALIGRKISLATPLLRNLRRPNGNLTSCFIIRAEDSRDSIFYIVDQISRISKHGGGIGLDVSAIRARDSSVSGIPGVSGGIVPWIKIFNDTLTAVNQTGARSGAGTIALGIWHRDILDFLEMQTENGDPRRKAFDIFPQVIIPDIFVERYHARGEWTLSCPHQVRSHFGIDHGLEDLVEDDFRQLYLQIETEVREGRLKGKVVKAVDISRTITSTQIETGLPYLAFRDNISRMNPNKADGIIPCGNLCQESYSNVKPTRVGEQKIIDGKMVQTFDPGMVHCCNLLSLNMATISEEDLAAITQLATQMLDASVDLTNCPVPEAQLHNDWYRTIGVGVMGWADWLALREIKYWAEEGLVEANRVFEIIAYNAYRASCDIAKVKGSFGAFSVSEQNKGILFGKTVNQLEKCALGPLWRSLVNDIQKYGLRNSQILAIAPTTSTSLIQGCTSSFLPPYGKFFFDKNGSQTVPICPPFLKDRFWFYKEFKNIEMKQIIDMTATIQQWIDTGISMELMFDSNNPLMSKREIFDTQMYAHSQGVKCVYYIRTIQKTISTEENCVSCSG